MVSGCIAHQSRTHHRESQGVPWESEQQRMCLPFVLNFDSAVRGRGVRGSGDAPPESRSEQVLINQLVVARAGQNTATGMEMDHVSRARSFACFSEFNCTTSQALLVLIINLFFLSPCRFKQRPAKFCRARYGMCVTFTPRCRRRSPPISAKKKP